MKKVLNLVPVAIYVLFESIFVAALISAVWFFGFKDIREHLSFTINYFQFVGIVWSAKMILNNMLAIAINTSIEPINNEGEEQ